MPIEHAHRVLSHKPWGMHDLRPWAGPPPGDDRIGEISYEREPGGGSDLCLKLLFADQPLSIQVHPNDAYAASVGLPSGKDEAWYVLKAAPGARIGVGLTQHLSRQQLRHAIDDGSIADLLLWRGVVPGDSCLVPAGTIHAIGGGLVIAELQQRVDATYRLFDHGRGRELHPDQAMATAMAEPSAGLFEQCRLSDTRRLIAADNAFVFERLDLPPNTAWTLDATCETWLLALTGGAAAGNLTILPGDGLFAAEARVTLRTGKQGFTALAGYAKCGPNSRLLRKLNEHGEEEDEDPYEEQVITCFTRAMTAFTRTRGGIAP